MSIGDALAAFALGLLALAALAGGTNATFTSGALKNLAIPASSTIAPSATDTLTFVFSLPTAADNSFQGLSQTFTITYTATQLAGTAR